MAGLRNDGLSKQTVDNDISNAANTSKDELNLIDLFLVVWKRKMFVFGVSIFPTLLVGLGIFLWPRDYTVSYTYNTSVSEVIAFKTLEDKFYSAENLEKLVAKLREDGLGKYAKKINDAKTTEDLKKYISFQISPSFIKPSEIKDYEELQKIQQVEGVLLDMHIMSKSVKNLRSIALVCRKNFEQIIPMYSEKKQLNSKIISLKRDMAGIEMARYTLNLKLERKVSTLEKLKSSDSQSLEKLPGDLILQFNNIDGDKAFLPLAYQVQAAETQIINLEGKIRENKEIYTYYTGLLKLNEKLLRHVESSMSLCHTLEQFRSFLTDMSTEYKENEQEQDYLSAYIKGIENKMASVIPLVEKPAVFPIPKGTIKKSGIVLVIALTMSVFVSFLLEGLENRSQQTENI